MSGFVEWGLDADAAGCWRAAAAWAGKSANIGKRARPFCITGSGLLIRRSCCINVLHPPARGAGPKGGWCPPPSRQRLRSSRADGVPLRCVPLHGLCPWGGRRHAVEVQAAAGAETSALHPPRTPAAPSTLPARPMRPSYCSCLAPAPRPLHAPSAVGPSPRRGLSRARRAAPRTAPTCAASLWTALPARR